MSEETTLMEYSVDLAEQDAPVPLPVGQYPGVIEGAVIKTSGNTGRQYFSVAIRIPADAYPTDFTEGAEDGEVLTYNRLLAEDTPRARYRVRKFCEAIGAPLGKTVDANEWLGMNVEVSIKNSEYEGELRAEIDKIVGSGS